MTLVVDDAQLMQLAVEPAQDAAWVLSRPSAFRPLVLLCCVVPPLWFAAWSSLDAETAPWALRALAVHQAERLEEWLEPGSQWNECELRAAPPLVSWLTASVLPWFPPGTALAATVISAISLIGAAAILWQWCCEAVGERTAFIVILLFAFHPQFATMAASGAPAALTFALIIAAAWGYWGHLDQNQGTVSFRLLAGGLAWGLAMLAGGGIAIAFYAVLMLAALVSRTSSSAAATTLGERSAIRAVLLLGATGAAIALWWPIMMWQSEGNAFFHDWLGIAPSVVESATLSEPQELRLSWSPPPSLLLGWWCLGCWSAVRCSLAKSGGRPQRWARWLLLWNAIGLTGRMVWYGLDGTDDSLRIWDAFLSLPALILSAQGLDLALRRETTRLGLAGAIAITVTVVGWQATHHIGAALLMGATMLAVLLLSAPLAIGLRRSHSTWSEGEIRTWVVIAGVATILGNAAVATIPLARREFDHLQWERLRQQLAETANVTQCSLVANDRRELTSWIYLVRSLWPKARVNIDATVRAEPNQPESRILLVDWSRNGLRFQADVGTGWQVVTVVEPIAFHGRRLAVHLIQPVETIPPL